MTAERPAGSGLPRSTRTGRTLVHFNRFRAVLVARNKEFLRDRGTLGWNLAFPLLVLVGFSFIFSGGSQMTFQVAVVGAADGEAQQALLETRHLEMVPAEQLEEVLDKLRRHRFDMVLRLGADPAYWVNEESPNGYLVERVLWGVVPREAFEKLTVAGKPIRYVDWLLPGLLAMNAMFSCLFGVGFVIVRYRKNGVLRRLKATPLAAFEFLAAQVVSRLFLVLATTVLVFLVALPLLDLQVLGSYLDIFLIFTLGSMSLVALGLLVSSRLRSEELAGGLLNLLTLPMMFLSGVWFSLEGAHEWVKRLALALPLTHFVDASRAVMVDGVGIVQVLPHLGVLAAMTLVFLVAGSLAFRWE